MNETVDEKKLYNKTKEELENQMKELQESLLQKEEINKLIEAQQSTYKEIKDFTSKQNNELIEIISSDLYIYHIFIINRFDLNHLMNMNSDILVDLPLPKGIYKTPTRFITEKDLTKYDYTHLQLLKEDIEKAIEMIKERISKRDYIIRIYNLLYYICI